MWTSKINAKRPKVFRQSADRYNERKVPNDLCNGVRIVYCSLRQDVPMKRVAFFELRDRLMELASVVGHMAEMQNGAIETKVYMVLADCLDQIDNVGIELGFLDLNLNEVRNEKRRR